MKTITKKLTLLDIKDIEEAISTHLGKKVAIGDVACTLIYFVPADTGLPNGMDIEFTVDDEIIDSFDLFYDDDADAFCLNGKELSLNELALRAEAIFNFDTSVFKSFDCYPDSSD